MTTVVAFLRAVNLGRRTAPARQLVGAVEGLGYRGAWTYINSGNVVLDASGPLPKLEQALEDAFEAALGFEATTFVRRLGELEQALAADPFSLSSGDTYFITFLKERLDPDRRAALEGLSNDFDTLSVVGRDVHWRMRGKSSDSQLRSRQWAEIVGRNHSTSRNTTMLRKLLVKVEQTRSPTTG